MRKANILLLVLALIAPTIATAQVPQIERAALIALYNSTNGAGWNNSTGWRNAGDTDFNDPGTECDWYGVACAAGTNVTQLDLYTNQLSGVIPPELGNLSSLVSLAFSSNDLTGSIPPELGNLTGLSQLHLHYNQLSGVIPPELGNLSSLVSLAFSSNDLTGSIPPELGNLAGLSQLLLHYNQLSGVIPPELGDLSSLQRLYLHTNQLTGDVPPELGSLGSLQWLYLNNNQLSGSIPPELGTLTSLRNFYLYSNQLSGSIPPELGNLTSLRHFHLYSNQLSGSIPPELGNLGSLQELLLFSNQLSGNIPAELGNLGSLRELVLFSNQLSGNIPAELGNLTSLQWLWLDSNQLVGAVPLEMLNLTGLFSTDLAYNGLYTNDPILQAFLDTKDPNWDETQTLPPTDLLHGVTTDFTAASSWTPILYTADNGGYELLHSTTPGGPYTSAGRTADKLESSFLATALAPGTPHYFVVRTFTEPHPDNQNRVVSDLSNEVTVTTSNRGCPRPEIAISGGGPWVLTASSGLKYNYLWSTGQTSQSIQVSPTKATRYLVTIDSPGLCEETASIVVGPFFSDGFESGGTYAWSNTAP